MAGLNTWSSWYKNLTAVGSLPEASPGVATQSTTEQIKRLTGQFESDNICVSDTANLEEVCQIVNETAAKYGMGRERVSKVEKWLNIAAVRIHHYSNILEVFVQHHPEYTALVWGTIKLVFVGVINHEKSLALFSKGLAQIAECLPRAELKRDLYQTPRMHKAVEELFCAIVEFLGRAYNWYKESKLRSVLHSITRPPELHYNDLLQRIMETTQVVDQLATAGSQAELRDLHNEVQNMHVAISALASKVDVEQVGSSMQELLLQVFASQNLLSSALIDTNQRLSDLQLSHILSSLSVSLDDPFKCYQYRMFFRKRQLSGSKTTMTTNKLWLSSKLQTWTVSNSSGLIIVRGPFSSQVALQHFCVDIIEQLQEASVPVLWALVGGTEPGSKSNCSMAELLKYLTSQAIRMNPAIRDERQMSLRSSRFSMASTSKEWLDIFMEVVQGVGRQVYIVIDMAVIGQAYQSADGLEILSKLGQPSPGRDTHLKVSVVTYTPSPLRDKTSNYPEFVVPVRIKLADLRLKRKGGPASSRGFGRSRRPKREQVTGRNF